MKEYREFVKEARAAAPMMEPDAYVPEAYKAAEWLDGELKKLFPDTFTKANVTTNLGEAFWVEVNSAPRDPSKRDRLAIDNANARLRLVMHFNQRGMELQPQNKFTFDMLQSFRVYKGHNFSNPVKVSYRKISGKTPMEATKKLLKKLREYKTAGHFDPLPPKE